MRPRLASPAMALILGGLTFALGAAYWVIAVLVHQSGLGSGAGSAGLAVSCGVVGVVVAWHQPRNPMGWILLGVGGFFSLTGAATLYSALAYRIHPGELPLGPVAVLAGPSWGPAVVLFGLAFLLFPDGRPASPRWRWVVRAYLTLGAVWAASAYAIAAAAIAGHDVHILAGGQLAAVNDPSGLAAALFSPLTAVFLVFTGVTWVSWLARQIAGYRRATGEHRQQLKWLMSGAAVCAVSGVITVVWGSSPSALLSVIGNIAGIGLIALPVSIGIGILKYRLYDIDRIISRTLAYAIVTGLLIGVYAGLVLLATRVLAVHGTVAVAAATLAAAALFSPLRRRVQHIVDRRFNRARYDADRTVTAFTARLNEAVDLGTVRDDLAATAQAALEPAHVSVWLTGGNR
jgi:hypothetical protein